MKKIFVFVLLAILAIVPSVYAQTCNCEDLQAQIDALTARIEALEGGAPVAEAEEEEAAASPDFEPVTVQDYLVEYVGYEFDKNYEGKDYIKITFHYTNNSSESKAYVWAVGLTAFQDGIELKDYYVTDNEKNTEIRPGKSIDIIEGFYLRSMTEPLELEFDIPISFNNDNKSTRFLNIQ